MWQILEAGGPARRLLSQARLEAVVAWGGSLVDIYGFTRRCGTKEGVAGGSEFLLAGDELEEGDRRGPRMANSCL